MTPYLISGAEEVEEVVVCLFTVNVSDSPSAAEAGGENTAGRSRNSTLMILLLLQLPHYGLSSGAVLQRESRVHPEQMVQMRDMSSFTFAAARQPNTTTTAH